MRNRGHEPHVYPVFGIANINELLLRHVQLLQGKGLSERPLESPGLPGSRKLPTHMFGIVDVPNQVENLFLVDFLALFSIGIFIGPPEGQVYDAELVRSDRQSEGGLVRAPRFPLPGFCRDFVDNGICVDLFSAVHFGRCATRILSDPAT